MNLIIIYGPPGVGKLAVANELSKVTGLKVFHNRVSVDILNKFLKFGTALFWEANLKIRLAVFEAAAKEKIKGLIFTFCYAYPDDNKNIRKIVNIIKKHGGKVHFVQLVCDEKTLFKRVKHASRNNFDKIRSVKKLDYALKKWDFFTKVPFVKTLVINNTEISAKNAAQMIKKHHKL